MVKTLTKYKVELNGDLLMIKDLQGNLLKGMAVKGWNAVDRFNEMVEKVKELETKNLSK
jgi:hypothetical protein